MFWFISSSLSPSKGLHPDQESTRDPWSLNLEAAEDSTVRDNRGILVQLLSAPSWKIGFIWTFLLHYSMGWPFLCFSRQEKEYRDIFTQSHFLLFFSISRGWGERQKRGFVWAWLSWPCVALFPVSYSWEHWHGYWDELKAHLPPNFLHLAWQINSSHMLLSICPRHRGAFIRQYYSLSGCCLNVYVVLNTMAEIRFSKIVPALGNFKSIREQRWSHLEQLIKNI